MPSGFTPGKINWSLFHFQSICSGLINYLFRFATGGTQLFPFPPLWLLFITTRSTAVTPSVCWVFDVMWIICRKLCGAFQVMQLHVRCGCSVVWLLELFWVYCPENQHRKLSYANSHIPHVGVVFFVLNRVSSVILTSVTTPVSSKQAEMGVRTCSSFVFSLRLTFV